MDPRLRFISRLLCQRCNGCGTFFRRLVSYSANCGMEKKTQRDTGAYPIVSVFRQALATFNPKTLHSQRDFSASLQKLKTMMDGLRSSDVSLDNSLMSPLAWDAPRKAPCTYVELFENENINVSIFIIRPGYKMPLHDHPQMHGLLKVISGAVRLRSFTKHDLICDDESGQSSSSMISSKQSSEHTLCARIVTDTIFKETSETCILSPYEANYHEIESLQSPAAFIDILSPPYDTLMDNNTLRLCTYYKVINEISTNVVQLEKIKTPPWFYCDQAPYLGPLLM